MAPAWLVQDVHTAYSLAQAAGSFAFAATVVPCLRLVVLPGAALGLAAMAKDSSRRTAAFGW